MRSRILSALVLLPVVVAAVIVGNPWWGALLAVVAVLATKEMVGIANAGGMRPDRWLAYVVASALALTGLIPDIELVRPVLVIAVIGAYAAQIARAPAARSIHDWLATIAMPVAVGALTSYGVLIRGIDGGLAWTLLVLVMVWANDSAAYLAGRAFGHTPFFSSISPKKTLEGAAAGALAAMVVGLAAPSVGVLGPDALAPLAAQSPVALATLGLAVSIVAPAGDLSQSFLKRQVGVKDSGQLIPGHGGVLDRIDSLLFAAPVAYYAALVLGGGWPGP